MNNLKPQKQLGFGRDANEFLMSLEKNNGEGQIASSGGISIVSLVPNDCGVVKACVLVENEAGSENKEFSLLCEFVDELGLSIGDIDGDIASEIEGRAEITRAYASACNSIAFADSSCRALVRKLIAKGFDRGVAEEAVGVALSRGLIDENNTVESRVRIFLGKRWGRTRIIAKLREEGFGDKSLRHALQMMAETDFVELCLEHLKRKNISLPSDMRERDKLYASLARHGYSSSEIREALRKLSEE